MGGTAENYWLQDKVLALNESEAGQVLEIGQAASADAEFAVPVVAYGKWFTGTVWDQVLELRPQAEIPPNSVRTVRVTMPLRLRLDTVAGSIGLERFNGRTMDFFVRWDEPHFDSFPRLLTVTVNTTDGGCARDTTVLEEGSDRSAARRATAFLDRPVKFKDLCAWSPPSPPA